MKRDPRLHGLSSDHHHALVLAHRLAQRVAEGSADAEVARRFAEDFAREIAPHFEIEEEVLLPALRAVGEVGLAQRTETEHAELRALVAVARTGGCEELGRLAQRLREHVRFEERELFPVCEAKLPDAVLAAVASRAPHGR
ncbi:MAG TPA: hemerythrin domain-containing protein [Nannocystis sp.]